MRLRGFLNALERRDGPGPVVSLRRHLRNKRQELQCAGFAEAKS
jgi:hypothetical protein